MQCLPAVWIRTLALMTVIGRDRHSLGVDEPYDLTASIVLGDEYTELRRQRVRAWEEERDGRD